MSPNQLPQLIRQSVFGEAVSVAEPLLCVAIAGCQLFELEEQLRRSPQLVIDRHGDRSPARGSAEEKRRIKREVMSG
jgi:hypothetical protein